MKKTFEFDEDVMAMIAEQEANHVAELKNVERSKREQRRANAKRDKRKRRDWDDDADYDWN